MPSELGKLKLIEEENSKLKRIVTDLSLDKAIMQDVLSKCFKAFSQALAGLRLDGKVWG
jgi:putative transposase